MDKSVTFLISTISNGGAEAVCVNIANGLAECGWKVDLLVLHMKEKAYMRRLSSKVTLVDLKAGRARYAAPALLCYLIRKKPSKLVVFKYELIDLAVILKRLFCLKVKIVGRNISILSESRRVSGSVFKSRMSKIFENQIENVDLVINQSFEMEKDLLKIYPGLESRSVVIHNPVASHIEHYAKNNSIAAHNTRSYILCVGRLEHVKAFHHAISVFSLLAKKHPDLRLKFVGQGSLEQELITYAAKLDVLDRVDFEGFQSDVIFYYRNAVLTLLTSDYEGFPNVLIESIFLGTPVVSFDCPSGPREILDYGKFGKLVEPGNIELLAQAVEDVIKNPGQFDLIERSKLFSVEKAIDKYTDALRKLNV